MVLFATFLLVTSAQATQSAPVTGEIDHVSFAPRDTGIVIETRVSPSGEGMRLYFSPLPNLKPRLIAKGSGNFNVSGDGRLIATELDGDIAVFRLSDGRKVASSDGGLGAFSPDCRQYAFMDRAIPCVLDLKTGRRRAMENSAADIAHKAPASSKFEETRISGWDRRGIIAQTDYTVPGAHDYVKTHLYLDPKSGHVTGKAENERYPPRRLADGSAIVDELAAEDDSMMGRTRIVRTKNGVRRILFERGNISAGHEASAEFAVSTRAMRVIVYGATMHEPRSQAWIWDVDPLTGRKRVLVSGKYRMPSWADGNSMAVDVSSDGIWLAYDDFWDKSTVHLMRLPR